MSYYNVVEVESAIANLSTAYPQLTQLITLPNRTFENRTSHALRIGSGPPGSRDCVVLIGGIHAREWGSCEILINFATDVLAAFTTNSWLAYGGNTFTAAQIKSLVNRLDVIVFPLVNPDGRFYSQNTEAMWRKNRNPANAGGNPDPACVGVDINRNFDFLFNFESAFSSVSGVSISNLPCDYQVYKGPDTFSEPETQNVRWLLDANPRTRWFVDVHSHSEDILYNWSDDENQTTDPAMNFLNSNFDGQRGVKGDAYAEFIPSIDLDVSKLLAAQFSKGLEAVRGRTYTAKPSYDLYPTSGTSDSYAYARHRVDPTKGKIFGFTIEWGTEFQPLWPEMVEIIKDVTAGLIQFCSVAGGSCSFIIGRDTFGQDEIRAMLPDADFPNAFSVVVDGFRPQELGINSTADLANAPICPTITVTGDPPANAAQAGAIAAMLSANNFTGPVVPENPSLPDLPQRFTFPYRVSFTGIGGFPLHSQTATLSASFTAGGVTVTSSVKIRLIRKVDTYLPGEVSWLNTDRELVTARFYFFTDTNALDPVALPQVAADAFGPAGTDNAGNDKYQISSMHAAAFDPSAYAVCDGIVCAQDIPNTSPALVNLILRPLDRPPGFVPVRYYMYKGVRKDSLFAGADIAAAATNQLTQAIWVSQNAANQSANTNAPAPAAALGLDLTAASNATSFGDGQSIDNLFFRTGVDSQFPIVKGGWSIGTFDKTRFGFEILLDGLGVDHTLALARSLDDHVLVPTLPGSAPPDLVFAHWHQKEQVLGYMDPAAYYGSFYGGGMQAKTSTGTFDIRSGNTLYTGVVSSFRNKNKTYVDIRNEHNDSLDYFNNYGRNLQIGFDPTTPRLQIDYYAGGWPIATIEGTEFPSTNNTGSNTLRLALPAGDNALPLVYISQGYSASSDGFSRDLTPTARTVIPNLQGSFTDDVALVLPNVASSTAAAPVSSYVRLRYFKRIAPGPIAAPPGSPATVVTSNYLDNLFVLSDMKTRFSGPAPVKSAVYEDEIYVDARTADLGIDFIGKAGFATDDDNATFFAFPSFVVTGEEQGKTTPLSITGEVYTKNDTYLNLLFERYGQSLQKTVIALDVSAASYEYPVTPAADNTDPSFVSPNFGHLIALVLGKSVYQALLSLAASTFLPGYRVYLGVKNILTQTDAVGVAYTSYELVLRGYVLANGRIEVKEQNTDAGATPPYSANIKVYTR